LPDELLSFFTNENLFEDYGVDKTDQAHRINVEELRRYAK
jgi:hypothetical protein